MIEERLNLGSYTSRTFVSIEGYSELLLQHRRQGGDPAFLEKEDKKSGRPPVIGLFKSVVAVLWTVATRSKYYYMIIACSP
jgi:hypothetical protein